MVRNRKNKDSAQLLKGFFLAKSFLRHGQERHRHFQRFCPSKCPATDFGGPSGSSYIILEFVGAAVEPEVRNYTNLRLGMTALRNCEVRDFGTS